MLLLKTDTLPDDPRRWFYQLQLDGYRANRGRRQDGRDGCRLRECEQKRPGD
jgi:hypothetical protein